MAVLSNPDRQLVRQWFIDKVGGSEMTKPTIDEGVGAADDWADANTASYNSALATNAPNFSAAATNEDKALALVYVILRRWEIL
jgi:hypothetical protein